MEGAGEEYCSRQSHFTHLGHVGRCILDMTLLAGQHLYSPQPMLCACEHAAWAPHHNTAQCCDGHVLMPLVL